MVENSFLQDWQVAKIGVIGPGIVGMPMAALLAQAKIKIGASAPARVVVIQRHSTTSGWKVGAINAGRSTIGGVEPTLDDIVSQAVAAGLLTASHDYADLSDADVILICVQTDKRGFGPDYGPLFDGLNHLTPALQKRPAGKIPLIIFESTLAPSSMCTLIKDYFADAGLVEGRDVLLGNSPNRVMPGRLVERVRSSDKIVAGISPITPKLIQRLYAHIVTQGELLPTNSLTAEVVKTLENAYRDVRIAFSSEVVRICDQNDIDFYHVRDRVNERLSQSDDASKNPGVVPSGGLLIPAIGVGGHCLPKDGILLWWRKLEFESDGHHSLILQARTINDESPAETIRLAERSFGDLTGTSVALLGAAYRFDSEDTRNSPTLVLAKLLLDKSCRVTIHDPFVKVTDQNLQKFNLGPHFSNDLLQSLAQAELIILCVAHQFYRDAKEHILRNAPLLRGVVDGCNLFSRSDLGDIPYIGIGKGKNRPEDALIDAVYNSFRAVERGVANEVLALAHFLNDHYAQDDFNRITFADVQRLASTCGTGCHIADPGAIPPVSENDFSSRLVHCAQRALPCSN
ncbi:nucleotide sugar dehydrogenase [candidate division KSB1 bacterium]|nr:nucleotide sugar dehydrogenase [candidate division KSB1 bacterium]RQW03727.1 MAG: nucleotide sugar dehydrogenase [candidate division KSB1 bacterium]